MTSRPGKGLGCGDGHRPPGPPTVSRQERVPRIGVCRRLPHASDGDAAVLCTGQGTAHPGRSVRPCTATVQGNHGRACAVGVGGAAANEPHVCQGVGTRNWSQTRGWSGTTAVDQLSPPSWLTELIESDVAPEPGPEPPTMQDDAVGHGVVVLAVHSIPQVHRMAIDARDHDNGQAEQRREPGNGAVVGGGVWPIGGEPLLRPAGPRLHCQDVRHQFGDRRPRSDPEPDRLRAGPGVARAGRRPRVAPPACSHRPHCQRRGPGRLRPGPRHRGVDRSGSVSGGRFGDGPGARAHGGGGGGGGAGGPPGGGGGGARGAPRGPRPPPAPTGGARWWGRS
jgi:hypothetical protein